MTNRPEAAYMALNWDVVLHLNQEYLRRRLNCAFLAPDIVEAILDGLYPADLTIKKLCRRRLPLDWAEQRTQFGFPLQP